MRNLRTISRDLIPVTGDLPLTATAWDTTDDSIICAFGPIISKPFIELRRRRDGSQELTTITSWDAPSPLDGLDCDEVLLLQYFSDTRTACLVLAGGDVVVVREEPSPDQERIEIVGSVDAGIAAAAWAPDEELLAIVTRADTLVLMSKTFEPVTEATLTADDLKASKHVSVGWGKKETQFQGKRAKAMRDPTVPEHIDEGKPSPFENGYVSVSWRGDGAYFAVNAVVKGHRRVVRVFDREAKLDSASEPVDGLEHALAWRPAGNLIAGIKRSLDKIEVVFFERNGLRHGEFDLRLSEADLDSWAMNISLAWNVDSTVLAVMFQDRVQLWTMGNYHYYLKQEVNTHQPAEGTRHSKLKWHPESPLKLAVSQQDSMLDLTYLFSVSGGSTIPPYDYGVVAVIDGKTLKLTPLRQAGVPPPMALCEVQFSHNLVDVALSADGRRLVVLTTATLEFCMWEIEDHVNNVSGRRKPTTDVRFSHSVIKSKSILLRTAEIPAFQTFIQMAYGISDEIMLLTSGFSGNSTLLYKTTWRSEQDPTPLVPCNNIKGVSCLFSDSCQKAIWAYNGTIVEQIQPENEFDNVAILATRVQRNQCNTKIFESPLESDSLHNGYHGPTYHRICLDTNGALMADDRIIARGCTSFALTHAHLVFTTSQHLLKFVHLTEPSKMKVPEDTPEIDERCRSIERGAKIVTVMPSVYAVVLQMPRGNLETIYPRLLVLSGVRQQIQDLDYRSAFLACQSHQVDLNILYDLRPDAFVANVWNLVEQLKKPARIDELLSKLKDEDVTTTLYRDTLTQTANTEPPTVNGTQPAEYVSDAKENNKVNRICDAFLAVLSPKTSAQLQNIITAHVCKRPPDLKSALTLVSSLRQSSEEEADIAVSHLCFLTDTNRLFDAALALYDLELTLLVAQNAQRDPREYIPFLQSLQDLPVLRRQYEIDHHLHNYERALDSLHALKSHEEVERYTIRHNLYTHAISLYRYEASHLSSITRHYADYLASQSKHTAAAILYESLGDYSSAYLLYALAHQWRECLTCASLVPLEAGPLQDLATSLATTCADETRDYRSAATIHSEYLHDIPTSARLLCKGSYFAEAMRLLTLHSLKHDIPSIIDNSLTEKFGEIIELIADCKTQLAAQIPRIHDLRQKKEEDPLAFYGGDATLANADGADIPDNISLAATDASTLGGQSLFTRYGSNASKFGGTVASNVSRKTSKTKRREERKRARGKKGSVYEEEYLVASVGRLIERVNGVHDEVKRLVSGLLRRGMREQAAKVEEVVQEIVLACEKGRMQVWPQTKSISYGNTTDLNGGGEDTYPDGRPKGGDGVFWDSQMELNQQGQKDAPIVKAWSKNELVVS